MAAPPSIPNIGSQLDRGVVAYLTTANAGWLSDGPPATAAQIVPANSPLPSAYPEIKIHSQRSTNEAVGNNRFTVQIRVSQAASTVVNDPNPELQRVILDRLVGQVLAALLLSDNGNDLIYTAQQITAAGRALVGGAGNIAVNNADMANFACQYWFYMGHTRGEPSEPGAAWVEVITFEAVCNPAPTNVSQ